MSLLKLERPHYTKTELEQLQNLKNIYKSVYPASFLDILFYRNIRTEEDIDKFFHSTIHHLHDTSKMKDADKFIEILYNTINKNEEIVIYSDYDVDGITSASTALLSISEVGGIVHFYTNNRFIGGYGINKKGIDELLKKYPNTKLIITTDNGINAYEAVLYAKSKGLHVLITDHHEPGLDKDKKQILPNADAVIDPKRLDETYPFSGLCGCGVIFKLMLYYYFYYGFNMDKMYQLLDIVALGTISDMVPLQDENRILVKEGIKLLQNDTRYCFYQLRLHLDITKIDEDTLGFSYGPIMNALGRLTGGVDSAIEFFTTNNTEKIQTLIPELIALNEERKTLTKTQQELAESKLENKILPNAIIIYDESFHEGIIGLVAGKIKEKYMRPCMIFAKTEIKDEEKGFLLKASGRSVHSVHLKNCLDDLSEYLISFGGHEMAAGFSIYEKDLPAFEEAFNKLLEGTVFEETLIIDCLLNAKDISIELIESLELLKPFGMGFPKPNFGLYNFILNKEKSKKIYIGKEEDTVKLQNKEGLTVLMFHQANLYKTLGEPESIKAIGNPTLNVWNGNTSVQFIVKDNLIEAI